MIPQVQPEPEREALPGLVERVTFPSPESGFRVLRVKVIFLHTRLLHYFLGLYPPRGVDNGL